jgi:hypothetical protein
MAWSTPIAHTIAQSATTSTITTGAIDTTGADTIFVAVSWYIGAGGGAVLTDSKSNTWHGLTTYNDGTNQNSRIYYAYNATVGSGHTFTVTGIASYPALAVSAHSGGLLTDPFDQENGANPASGTSGQPGSVTPSENDEILVTMLGNQNTNSNSVSINSSYTLIDTIDRGANGIGVSLAYLIQTSASASNPTWSWGGANDDTSLAIATFKKAAGGGGGSTGFGPLLAGYRNHLVIA